VTILLQALATLIFALSAGAKVLALEARATVLHSGIWLIEGPSLFPASRPDCLIRGRTEIVKPLTDEGDQVEMECAVLGTLTITEDGARAAFIHSKIVKSDNSVERGRDHLFYIHTHEEMNCRQIARRYTHDWYMNRYLDKPGKAALVSSRDTGDWSKGIYADADTEWSQWEVITRSLSSSEKYLCSKWTSMKKTRFN
jgi:hypothetical protein